ncbi:MAG: hypothetical protein JXR96_23580 [Deltaproteobacteria bacterium]|nr:hypothetical protein [Deltaproteobacteria bacterium]
MRRAAFSIATGSILLVAAFSQARDLNRQNYLVGEKAAGMGGAFTAMTGDPASLFYNPAGLAGLYKRGLSLSASLYQAHWEQYERLLNMDVGLQTDMGSESFSTFPASVVYTLPLDENQGADDFHHVLSAGLIVPDFDKFEAKIDESIGIYPFELKGTLFAEELTYWAGFGYGISLWGRLRLGLSVFLLAHLSDQRSNLGLKVAVEDELHNLYYLYGAETYEHSGLSLTILAQAGVQYLVTDHFVLGLNLRSPTLGTLYSQVKMFMIGSSYLEDDQGNPAVTPDLPGYVDRIETDRATMNYKLPLAIAAGAAYCVPESWAVALDLSFHLPQDRFLLIEGAGVYPTDPEGNEIMDPDRALIPNMERQNSWVLNVNAGAEVYLFGNWMARLGVFTDFSTVDQDFYDRDMDSRLDALFLPRLLRFGLSVGAGRIGERSTTSVTITYVYGTGDTFNMNEIFGALPSRTDVCAHTLTFGLAGSADL